VISKDKRASRAIFMPNGTIHKTKFWFAPNWKTNIVNHYNKLK